MGPGWATWKASDESNPQAAQGLQLKVEGLRYALRLLDAFEPEFRELIDSTDHFGTA